MNNQASFARSRSVATFTLLTALAFALGAPPPPVHAAGFVVNSLADNTTSGDSLCTLREAIQSANNAGNGDCGTNSSDDDTIIISVSGTITLGSTTPAIISGQGTLTIDGSGQSITISGNNAVRVMVVNSGANLTLQNVTIANGKCNGCDGGGILNNNGTLTVNNSTFSGNSVSGGGGGIYNNNGTLTVSNSTFSGNSASNGGGIGSGGTLTVSNSTFSGNSATNVGGGVFNFVTATLKNTIVANSPSGGNCFDNHGVFTSDSHNLADDNTCGSATQATSAQINLQPLANNGGPTQTMALGASSVAIDTGDDVVGAAAVGSPDFGAGGKDQRGLTRPQGPHCDIGAYERETSTQGGPNFIVTVTGDGDIGICGAVYCSLREAINAANAVNTNDTITFSVSGTITLGSTLPAIVSGQGKLTIDGTGQSITISGNNSLRVLNVNSGANLAVQNVTIANGKCNGCDGGGIYNNNGTLTVNNSTFSGHSAGSSGGGIYNNDGTLTVSNSTFSGNSASGSNGGGGIFNNNGPLTVSNSIFSSNSADFFGGGIYNNHGTLTLSHSIFSSNSVSFGGGGGILNNIGTLTVSNSTFSGNSAPNGGGGILNTGTVTVTNSTFSGNNAPGSSGAGIFNNGGTATLKNTIVANSTSGGNCSGTFTADSHNLADDNTCGSATQATSAQINLQPLANNGGPTQTMALPAGSAALDAGTDVTTLNGAIDSAVTTVTVADGTGIPDGVGFAIQIDSEQMIVTTKASNTLTVIRAANGTTAASHSDGVGVNPAFDQRGPGFARKIGSAMDIGAYESSALPTAANGTISGTITELNGAPLAGVSINLSGTQLRRTITDANGNYGFAGVAVNGFYTVTPARVNYTFSAANRSFSLLGMHTEALFTATANGDQVNAIDSTEFFVRQQYLDILGREPDEGGLNYWSDQILACGSDASCTRARRIGVAAAFFNSAENQETSLYLYDMYAGTLGRRPAYGEFTADRGQVVGDDSLDAAKTTFAQNFVQRAEFVAKYPGAMNAEAFVESLIQSAGAAGGDLSSERHSLIEIYGQGADLVSSRSAVLRSLADDAAFKQSQFNQAFVLTEYFAYLRRDAETSGFNFWVSVLDSDTGNYRGMVCSFITAAEYQHRFSSVVSHSNAECGN